MICMLVLWRRPLEKQRLGERLRPVLSIRLKAKATAADITLRTNVFVIVV